MRLIRLIELKLAYLRIFQILFGYFFIYQEENLN